MTIEKMKKEYDTLHSKFTKLTDVMVSKIGRMKGPGCKLNWSACLDRSCEWRKPRQMSVLWLNEKSLTRSSGVLYVYTDQQHEFQV
jgi:hypothetical protein